MVPSVLDLILKQILPRHHLADHLVVALIDRYSVELEITLEVIGEGANEHLAGEPIWAASKDGKGVYD